MAAPATARKEVKVPCYRRKGNFDPRTMFGCICALAHLLFCPSHPPQFSSGGSRRHREFYCCKDVQQVADYADFSRSRLRFSPTCVSFTSLSADTCLPHLSFEPGCGELLRPPSPFNGREFLRVSEGRVIDSLLLLHRRVEGERRVRGIDMN